MSRPPTGMSLPPMTERTKWILGGLLGLYVVEQFALGAGAPIGRLVWDPSVTAIAPWTPFTRVFVQGPNFIGVAISLIVLYFLLPILDASFRERDILEALGASWVLGTALPLGAAMALGHGGIVAGWGGYVLALFCLIALRHPDETVYLFFAIPLRAEWLLWSALGIPGLLSIVRLYYGVDFAPSLELVGAWLGVFGWWHLRGPYRPKPAAPPPRPKRPRFQVLEGGKEH